MAQEWYIDYGDRVEGPVSSRDLQTRASSGTLLSTHRVSPDQEKWVPASRIKGLTFAEPPKPPASKPVSKPPASKPASPPLNRSKTAALGEAMASSAGPAETWVHDPTAMQEEAAAATDDQAIPGYEILGTLGAGGMGVVYKARQLKLDRLVALKTIPVSASSSRMIARFEKEAVALAKLQHPNIVNVFDFGRAGERVFFAMEILSGEDLAQRIGAGPLDERTVWVIARQTAAALAHAAAQGIYHRDIKPHNLFLVPMPTGFGYAPDLPMVKVTDFGLALTKREAEVADERLTAAGTVLGTPAYMAPEQFKTTDVDHRADMYSLGASVYHALAGKPPFGGNTVWDVMVSKIAGEYPPLDSPVSPESNELISAMMAPEIADRIPSYEELIRRIDELPAMRNVAGTSTTVPALESGGRSQKPQKSGRILVLGLAAGVLCFLGLGVAAFFALAGKPATTPTTADPGPEIVYKPTYEESLFNGESGQGWIPLGGAVTVDRDKEQAPVLSLEKVKRGHPPFSEYRILLGIDLASAKSVEISFAIQDKNPARAPRAVIRISREGGAIFGTRIGDAGEFQPIGEAVPYPTREELEDKVPYQEVKFGRAGGKWSAFFRGQLLGTAPDDGSGKLDEFRIVSTGGPVLVISAALQKLEPSPP